VGGGFGKAFFWHQHPDCIVQAVSDLIPERRDALMQTYKCAKSYESLEKLILDRNIDAVAVFTGAPDHVRHTTACLRAGNMSCARCGRPNAGGLPEARRFGETNRADLHDGRDELLPVSDDFSAKVLSAGKVRKLFYVESEYMHPGIESLYFTNGNQRAPWFAPNALPDALHIALDRRDRGTAYGCDCIGWGDDDRLIRTTPTKTVLERDGIFKTSRGNSMRIANYRKGA